MQSGDVKVALFDPYHPPSAANTHNLMLNLQTPDCIDGRTGPT